MKDCMFAFEENVGHTMSTYCVLGTCGTSGTAALTLPMLGYMIGSHAYLMASRASFPCPGWGLPADHTPSLVVFSPLVAG